MLKFNRRQVISVCHALILFQCVSGPTAFAFDITSKQSNRRNKSYINVEWVKDPGHPDSIKFEYCTNGPETCRLIGNRYYTRAELNHARSVLKAQGIGVGVAGVVIGVAIGGFAASAGIAASGAAAAGGIMAQAGVGVFYQSVAVALGAASGGITTLLIQAKKGAEVVNPVERMTIADTVDPRFTTPGKDARVDEALEIYRDRLEKVLRWIDRQTRHGTGD